jgi:hypothetical protein
LSISFPIFFILFSVCLSISLLSFFHGLFSSLAVPSSTSILRKQFHSKEKQTIGQIDGQTDRRTRGQSRVFDQQQKQSFEKEF